MGFDLTGPHDPDREELLGDDRVAGVQPRSDHHGPVTVDADDADHIAETGEALGHPVAGLAFKDHRRSADDRHDVELQSAMGKVVYFFTTEDVVDAAGYVASTIGAALRRAA